MSSFLITLIVLIPLLILVSKTSYFINKSKTPRKKGFNSNSTNLKLSRDKHQRNLIQERILNEKMTTVTQLNAELELCKAFDNLEATAELTDKILEILIQDESDCSIEKLLSLEYIKGTIQKQHLASLKKIFIDHGNSNYLLAIEIYQLIEASDDCAEKFSLLDFMNQQVNRSPEFINNFTRTKAS
jgi:hypothetical protein